jgi:hypothetical protein
MLIEITKEIFDFEFCTFDDNAAEIYRTGRIICPPDKGGWSSNLAWKTGRWWIEYDAKHISPVPIKLFFDIDEAMEARTRIHERVSVLVDRATSVTLQIEEMMRLGDD